MSLPSLEKLSLSDMEQHDVGFWCFPNEYQAKVVKVSDGDTVHVIFQYLNDFIKMKVRLIGCDTPELKSPDAMLKQKAQEAKEYLSNLVLGKIVLLKCVKFDNFTRILGNLYLGDLHVNKEMADKYGQWGKAKYNTLANQSPTVDESPKVSTAVVKKLLTATIDNVLTKRTDTPSVATRSLKK